MNNIMGFRFPLLARIGLLCVMASLVGIAPSAPTVAYAAGSIWCVRASGGLTASPCKNATAYTTIQDAVNQARAQGDEIRVADGTYVGNQSGVPVVLTNGKTVPLTGGFQNNNWTTPGPASGTIIDGQGVRAGVRIQGQGRFTISNLTVQNGGTSINTGAVGASSGISMNEPNSVLILSNVILKNNHSWSDGGGVYSPGEVIVRDSNFSGNVAENRGGGLYATWADVDGSSFVNNRAFIDGGGLSAPEAIISNSSFTNNTANSGGGVYTRSQIILINTDFIGNRAGGNGGGLKQDVFDQSRADIFGGRFYNNTATGHGGGLITGNTLVMTGTQVISNSAGLNGGGLFAGSGLLQASDAVFDHNSAAGDGGGISAHGRAVLLRAQITANQAQANGGGLVQENGTSQTGQLSLLGSSVEGNQAARSGGGITIVGNSSLTLASTRVAGNAAGRDGGGLASLPVTSAYPVALTLSGGFYERNRAGRSGGGIYADLNLMLRSAQVVSNTATLNGGGIRTGAVQTNLTGVLLGNNRTSSAGDQLYVDNAIEGLSPIENGQINLTNVTVANTALAPHAAIQVQGKQANITLSNTIVVSHTIGIARAGGSILAGSYDDLFGNTSDQTVDGTAAAIALPHLLSSDPDFRGQAPDDFHLAADSPLIDAGNPAGNYTNQFDMDGQRMPAGAGPDIGADEFYGHSNYLALVRR